MHLPAYVLKERLLRFSSFVYYGLSYVADYTGCEPSSITAALGAVVSCLQDRQMALTSSLIFEKQCRLQAFRTCTTIIQMQASTAEWLGTPQSLSKADHRANIHQRRSWRASRHRTSPQKLWCSS